MEEFVTEDELKRWQIELDILCEKVSVLYEMMVEVKDEDERKELAERVASGSFVVDYMLNEMLENHCGDTKH